jgi:hypothetical protein
MVVVVVVVADYILLMLLPMKDIRTTMTTTTSRKWRLERSHSVHINHSSYGGGALDVLCCRETILPVTKAAEPDDGLILDGMDDGKKPFMPYVTRVEA